VYKRQQKPEVRFSDGDKAFIPGRDSGSPGTLKAYVSINGESFDGKTFVNEMFVKGPQHQEVPVRLIVKVRYVSRILLYLIIMLHFVIGIVVSYPFLRRFQNRHLYIGEVLKAKFKNGIRDSHDIVFAKKVLGTFKYEGQDLFDNADGTVLFTTTRKSHYTRDGQLYQIDGSYVPEIRDKVCIGGGKDRLEFRINSLPIGVKPVCAYRIERSPAGAKNSTLIIMSICAVFLLLPPIIGFFNPYLLLQLFKM
jgi:hypothetical protein